ncbi:asparagine synthase (glutamine-hydrolyzing) [Priestia megaterium]
MCGYVGYVLNSSPSFKKISHNVNIKQLNSMIYHRGPDNQGYYKDDYVYFGFSRLSIIDLEQGNQPLSYDDENYWIVFNGEIYNYVEIKEHLIGKGYEFQTSSDTEVLLALYKDQKEKALKHLRGMFSFVIWDKREQLLFGARDPFGIKPFYYLERDDKLFFSSEKKSLLETKTIPIISPTSLQHYLSYQYVPEPETMDVNIKKLQPGHYFTKKLNQTLKIQQYCEAYFSPKHKVEDQFIKEIREVLTDSVKMHMRSDVPVGSFLSGGIDSSLIASIAKEFHPDLKTFSVGFEAEGYSEMDIAKETAEKLGVENIQYTITSDEFVHELPKIVWHLDDPLADPSAVPLYFLAREARKHVKVVLSGEGADELFGGYNIYREPHSLRFFKYIPSGLHETLNQISNIIPQGIKGKSLLERGTTPLQQRYIGNAKIFTELEKSKIISSYKEYIEFTDITSPYYAKAHDYDDVSKMQFIDVHTWLRGDILLKADKMTMAHSLELRVPFLDTKVFNVANKIPTNLKIANNTTKYILRKAAEGIVPDHVLTRRKLGFPVPIRHWLKHELYDWAIDLVTNSNTEHLLNKEVIMTLIEQHALGKFDNSRKIWTVLIFLLWYQVFVEQEYDFAFDYPTKQKGIAFN